MAEILLEQERIPTIYQERCCICVPQEVRMEPWNPRGSAEPHHKRLDSGGAQRVAVNAKEELDYPVVSRLHSEVHVVVDERSLTGCAESYDSLFRTFSQHFDVAIFHVDIVRLQTCCLGQT